MERGKCLINSQCHVCFSFCCSNMQSMGCRTRIKHGAYGISRATLDSYCGHSSPWPLQIASELQAASETPRQPSCQVATFISNLLCYAAFSCAVLCCAAMCCAVPCCAALRCAVLCCAVLRCAVLCCLTTGLLSSVLYVAQLLRRNTKARLGITGC